MKILLLRHGPAVDLDASCPIDSERPLSVTGRSRTRAAFAGLAALDVRPRQIATSPYLRARQTAALAHEILAPASPEPLVVPSLVPGGDPRAVLAWLAERDGDDEIACVSHMPMVDVLLALLVGADRPFAPFGKAGAACLDLRVVRPGGAELVFLATPRMLRRLGQA